MTAEHAPQPIGQPVTLDDGRTVWIRVSPAAARLESSGHHWHRWAVDDNGRRVAVASYEACSPVSAEGALWVARGWRHVGLGRRLAGMLTETATRHGIEWLVLAVPADDAAAQRLLAEGGWIVARRVRDGHARVAIRLAHHLRPGLGTTAPRAA